MTICRTCGMQLEQIGEHKYKCPGCGNVYEDNQVTSEERIKLENAWLDERQGKFEEAEEKFDIILGSNKKCADAWYGKLLCKYGIIFTDDYAENKKVPTCYSSEISSVLQDEMYNKAIAGLTGEALDSRVKQCEQIEKIRKEWTDKASKERPYDVFISFKDTIDGETDNNGQKKRTEDSIEAENLYSFLTNECGFRVFFSRVSLRAHVAEKYEPYIFNALKTAKVMILYGHSKENMNATWVKNEWTRWIKQIERGEKLKNSLLVVYKNMNPYNLPEKFKGMQAIDAGQQIAYMNIKKHIDKVLKESHVSSIDTIDIKTGKVSKKSVQKNNQIKLQELQNVVMASSNASLSSQLGLVDNFIKLGKWEAAQSFLSQIKEKEPNNGKVMAYQLLVDNRLHDFALLKDYNNIKDIDLLDEIIQKSDKEFAEQILEILDDCVRSGIIKDEKLPKIAKNVFDVISKYNYAGNKQLRQDLLKHAVKVLDHDLFHKIYAFLNVDEREDALVQMIDQTMHSEKLKLAQKYVDEMLNNVNEGNIRALIAKLCIKYDQTSLEELFANCWEKFDSFDDIKNILEYCENANKMLAVLKKINQAFVGALSTFAIPDKNLQIAFIEKYTNFAMFIPQKSQIAFLKELSDKARLVGLFDIAMHFYKLCLRGTADDTDIYWSMLLCDVHCCTEEQTYCLLSDIADNQYYMKAMLAGATNLDEYARIVNKQIECVKENTKNVITEILAEKQRFVKRQDRKKRVEKQKAQAAYLQKKQNKKKRMRNVWRGFFGIGLLVTLSIILASFKVPGLYQFWYGWAIKMMGNENWLILIAFLPLIVNGIAYYIMRDNWRSFSASSARTKIGLAISVLFVLALAIGMIVPTVMPNISTRKIFISDKYGGYTLILKDDNTYQIEKAYVNTTNCVLPEVNPIDNLPITSIGKEAFAKSKIKNLFISKNLIEIGSNAFSNSKVSSLIAENTNLQKIGDYAFDQCDNLRKIKITTEEGKVGQVELGAMAFSYHKIDKGFIFTPDKRVYNFIDVDISAVKSIDRCAFYGVAVQSIKFGNSLRTLKSSALSDAIFAMDKLELPEGLETIEYAGAYIKFANSGSTLVLPSSISVIEKNGVHIEDIDKNNCYIKVNRSVRPDGWDTKWTTQTKYVIWLPTE